MYATALQVMKQHETQGLCIVQSALTAPVWVVMHASHSTAQCLTCPDKVRLLRRRCTGWAERCYMQPYGMQPCGRCTSAARLDDLSLDAEGHEAV